MKALLTSGCPKRVRSVNGTSKCIGFVFMVRQVNQMLSVSVIVRPKRLRKTSPTREVFEEAAVPARSGAVIASASRSTRRARSTTGLSTIVPLTASTPSLWLSKASITLRAHSISPSLGAKTRLIVSSCAGWMQALPRKPRARARRHCSSSPAVSSKSRCTTSNGPRSPAAVESNVTFERA